MDYLPVAHKEIDTERGFIPFEKSRPKVAEALRHYVGGRSQTGFTLIEALVALFVLTVGIVPVLMVGFSSRHVAEVVEHNLVAANLAQEGAEVIRGIRDTNWIASASFDTGLNDGDYEVIWNSTALMPYGGKYLTISPTGLYSYAANPATIFQRKISLTKVSPSELKVITSIFWNERKVSKSIDIEDHLFDWY